MIFQLRNNIENFLARVFGRIFWPVVAVIAITIKENKVLLINFYGEYGLPGGICKINESLENAVRREVKEETGLDVEVKRLLFIDPPVKYPRIALIYECEVKGGSLKNSFEGKAEFIPINNLPEKMREKHKDFIRRYVESLNDNF